MLSLQLAIPPCSYNRRRFDKENIKKRSAEKVDFSRGPDEKKRKESEFDFGSPLQDRSKLSRRKVKKPEDEIMDRLFYDGTPPLSSPEVLDLTNRPKSPDDEFPMSNQEHQKRLSL